MCAQISIANVHLSTRLEGIQQQLIGGYVAGRSMSSATKGTERETFVNGFLSEVFPRPFRFGTGDAIDAYGNKSGQLDVVIEYPFSPSLLSIGSAPRLYLAESIAAVIEVKSDLSRQWDEAVATANALRPITRAFRATMSMGPTFDYIPLFVVGYTGWKTWETTKKHLDAAPSISGVLSIDEGIFVGSKDFKGARAVGPLSLWALISSVHIALQSLKAVLTDPYDYLMGLPPKPGRPPVKSPDRL